MLKNLFQRLFDRRLRNEKDALGLAGEKLAARYLRRKLGMRIVARRVRCPGGELDLVAFDKTDLVFIEVRTRRTEDFGPPETTLGSDKIAALRRSAQWFARSRHLNHYPLRMDVVAVVWPHGKPAEVRYHRNAIRIDSAAGRRPDGHR